MRQGFIIMAVALWVAITIIGSIGEMKPMLGVEERTTLDTLGKPEIVDQNFISGIVSTVSKIGDYIVMFGQIFVLYHPALWQGSAIYIYYFVILPIGISFWVVVAFALKGTGSS